MKESGGRSLPLWTTAKLSVYKDRARKLENKKIF